MEEQHRGYPEPDDLASPPLYRTYVLRCWLEPREEPAWRFSLLEVGGADSRQGFTRFDDLVTYLQAAMAAVEAERLAGIDRLVEVFQRASCDAAYREAFKTDPNRVLAEAGLQVPDGISYQVVENTPTCAHIVLPPLVAEEELSIETLEPRATKSTLLCVAGQGHGSAIALIPGCNLVS